MRLAIISVLTLMLIGCGKDYWVDATIVGKSYTPSAVGVGPSFGGRGGVAVITTPESYTIIVRDNIDGIHSIQVNPEFWADAKEGQHVEVEYNTIWGTREVRR